MHVVLKKGTDPHYDFEPRKKIMDKSVRTNTRLGHNMAPQTSDFEPYAHGCITEGTLDGDHCNGHKKKKTITARVRLRNLDQ